MRTPRAREGPWMLTFQSSAELTCVLAELVTVSRKQLRETGLQLG